MLCPTSEPELEDLLSTPSEADRAALAALTGNLLLLGAGGKMGPSLARLAKRAAPHLNVIAVARFSEAPLRPELERDGIETHARDLLVPGALDTLPDAENVIYLAARKFGTAGDASPTWATNTVLPGLVAQRYAKSRIISWSTGQCVSAGAGGEWRRNGSDTARAGGRIRAVGFRQREDL